MNFSNDTYNLLIPFTEGNKLFYSDHITGKKFESNADSTLLFEYNKSGETYELSKYKKELLVAAFNPVNPRTILDDGCKKCNNKLVSYVLIGENKKLFYTCVCGNIWN